jgi:hypothetical protein
MAITPPRECQTNNQSTEGRQDIPEPKLTFLGENQAEWDAYFDRLAALMDAEREAAERPPSPDDVHIKSEFSPSAEVEVESVEKRRKRVRRTPTPYNVRQARATAARRRKKRAAALLSATEEDAKPIIYLYLRRANRNEEFKSVARRQQKLRFLRAHREVS